MKPEIKSDKRPTLAEKPARNIDELSFTDRIRLKPKVRKHLWILIIFYILGIASAAVFLDLNITKNTVFGIFLPYIVVLSFLFEITESAAGMGFGTSLSPILLLIFGFNPLAVVPALLITQTVTGLITGWMHNDFGNVKLSLQRPFNDQTKAVLSISVISAIGALISVLIAYFAIHFNKNIITGYVTILVFVMAGVTLFRKLFRPVSNNKYQPKKLLGFAAVAGFNKGIGGGGYGPVTTMGQLYSGMHEKAAAAITCISEGFACLVGVIAYFFLETAGVDINFMLLPSLLAGSFLAAIIAPYSVRIIPNRVYQYIIPGYALAIAIFLFYAFFFL